MTAFLWFHGKLARSRKPPRRRRGPRIGDAADAPVGPEAVLRRRAGVSFAAGGGTKGPLAPRRHQRATRAESGTNGPLVPGEARTDRSHQDWSSTNGPLAPNATPTGHSRRSRRARKGHSCPTRHQRATRAGLEHESHSRAARHKRATRAGAGATPKGRSRPTRHQRPFAPSRTRTDHLCPARRERPARTRTGAARKGHPHRLKRERPTGTTPRPRCSPSPGQRAKTRPSRRLCPPIGGQPDSVARWAESTRMKTKLDP